jgi:Kazal-type serine protease inhibitor domain
MKIKIIVLFAAALALGAFVHTRADAVGLGKACIGSCDAGLFCQLKPGQCFVPDVTGVCAQKPKSCPEITSPKLEVCGCNGQTYLNDCGRQQAGVSLAHKGKCE